MSSELEESTDHPDESNINSDAALDQSFDDKGNGPREHAKPRRRRRGKKRKQKKESAATCEAENHEECESELHAESEHGECDSPEWGSDDNLTFSYDTLKDVMIRPVNVPKAPLNSTQFIMDDHDDCRFYINFETPNPYGDTDPQIDRLTGDIIEPIGEDAAYIDIDYQYESPQDFDNSAYYDKEFEQSYKNNRFEELMRFPRNDLIKKLQSLESRLKELNEDLVKENPSPVLEKLQAELLELQEKNSYLQECNEKLTKVLLENEGCGEVIHKALAGVSVSSVSQDEHESEDSERDVFKECNEVVMSEDIVDVFNTSNEEVEMDRDQPGDGKKSSVIEEERNKDSGRLIGKEESCAQVGLDGNPNSTEQDADKHVDGGESMCSTEDQGPLVSSGKLLLNIETEECSSSSATFVSSQDTKSKYIHSHSHIVHIQPNSIPGEELRTLNIISSDIFHNASQTKCSSSVPLEGGMSPSETSVN